MRAPSVLVVLVVHDGAPWLRETLHSLAQQTHPRLGIIAIDNASTDGSRDILTRAIGEDRVVALAENRGLAGALAAAEQLPAAAAADYLFLLHDDVALSPDAVVRLVEAAEGIEGLERVGVVGPKVVDWDDPRVLREVGRSTDTFGHPYTPLQEGEIDQGQYDRVLEVLFVSSCAMLISREAWQRTGPFDERFVGRHDDLDFCWRARLAGFRVLMTPLAQARHRAASARRERDGHLRHPSGRYLGERAAVASMLKDYGIPTLSWLLPVYVVLGLARLISFALSRRFEDAADLVAAWGWNVVHLPGTLRRRLRAQSVRRVGDRSVRRFMARTLRVPRWFERAEALLASELETTTDQAPPVRERARSIVAAHPVLVASALALVLGILAYRPFVGSGGLQGGAALDWPSRAMDFFHELASPVRSTLLGGVQPASPALAGLGALSWLAFGSPSLAEKMLLCALPVAAGVTMYRAVARQTGERGAAVVSAAAYVLSALVLWAFSEGRIPILVGVAVMPSVWDRLDQSFSADGPSFRTTRFVVGLGAAVALIAAFEPGLLLGLALVAGFHLFGRRPFTGVRLSVAGAACATALVFPLVPELVRAPGRALGSTIGTTDVWAVLRSAPGSAPGGHLTAAVLPLAAIVSFSVVGRGLRLRAWRALALALAGLVLAWASANRFLPEATSNAPAYLVAGAVGEAALIGFGVASLASTIARERFGYRQIAAALLAAVLGVGLGGQALLAAVGDWAVGQGAAGLPPAWPVIASSPPGAFEILWLGRVDGRPFPAPGGDPQGVIPAGAASVRFAVTDRDGASALDLGRGLEGPGPAYLRSAVQELVSGTTQTAGALLAPLGVRFVVAADGDLPASALERLDQQLDLDRVPAGGLTIYRNARVLPVASVVSSRGFARSARTATLAEIAASAAPSATALSPSGEGWAGSSEGGFLYLARQYVPGWTASASGDRIEPAPAFGWATGFADVPAGTVRVTFDGGWIRPVELAVLAILWLSALWITRKPGSA